MKYIIWSYETGSYISENGLIQEFNLAEAALKVAELAKQLFETGKFNTLEDAYEQFCAESINE